MKICNEKIAVVMWTSDGDVKVEETFSDPRNVSMQPR